MKRLGLVLVLLLAVGAVQLFAQDFSSLPAGSWIDTNYNGTWTFSATGISITDNASGRVTTFTTSNIQNLRAVRTGLAAGISFASSAHGKTYNFFPNAAEGTMTLTIDRQDQPQYSIVMRRAQ